MKKVLILIVISCFVCFKSYSQEPTFEASIVELAKIYKKFNNRNSPPAEVYAKLKKLKTPQLRLTVEFIRQLITNNNSLTNKSYLIRPDSLSLKYLYAIKELSGKLSEEASNNEEIATQVMSNSVSSYETLDNYYHMLFSSVYYKNQPFNFTKSNFVLDKYQLRDETEKGIFVLQLINICNKELLSLENGAEGKLDVSYELIKKFPKINGQEYYKYTELNFNDFEIVINGKSQSYKGLYLDKYYHLLLVHLEYFEKINSSKEKEELILTSILNESAYYKYSKNEEALKNISTMAIGN